MNQWELANTLRDFLQIESKSLSSPFKQIVITPTYDVDLNFVPTSTPSAAIRSLGYEIEESKKQRLIRYRFGVACFERWMLNGENDAKKLMELVDGLFNVFKNDSFLSQNVHLTTISEVGEMETFIYGKDRFIYQTFIVNMHILEVLT